MKLILIFLLAFPFITFSQDCDCESTFNWTKKTFEENDAGFQYILDTKGEQAYAYHNKIFVEKINQASDLSECTELMNEWLLFFREGHLGIQYLGHSQSTAADGSKENEPKERESYVINLDQFKRYLNKNTANGIEGFWETSSYVIGIKQVDDKYIGFIINSKVEEWKKDEVKLKIFMDGEKLNSVFYMRDGSPVESKHVVLLDNNNLVLGNTFLRRTYPDIKDSYKENLYVKAMNSDLPFMERLNETTLYLRIPSFNAGNKKHIDSVLQANKSELLSTENLIIDIRNGTGGADSSYSELIPYLYTNPIRTVTLDYYSTPLNNQRMLDFSNNEGLAKQFNITFSEEERKEIKAHYDTLSQHLGELVNLEGSSVYVKKLDTVHEYPKNVAVVQNKNNGSTDEQFLLEAKQSKKVKLFGVPTHGVLDISNMNFVLSPCGDFYLGYGITKSRRIPDMAIDNIGIQPDYYIDKDIPEHEWIEYVNKVLNE